MTADQHHTDENAVRQLILDNDWSEADLREAARILDQVESSAPALEALRDYDRLRTMLRPSDTEADAEPTGGWEAFKARAMAAGSLTLPRRRRWRLPIAAAACLAVAAAIWLTYSDDRPAEVYTRGGSRITAVERATPPTPPPREQHSAELFQQVSAVFDGKASWVAVTEDDSQLGLAAEPMTDAGQLLLLRLTVTRRGEVVSEVDMAILPGQAAELTVPFDSDDKLVYNIDTSADKPATMAIWARLDNGLGDCRTLAALMTQLRTAAEPGPIAGQLLSRHGDYEFRVDFSQQTIGEVRP